MAIDNRLSELRDELEVTDKLLESRNQVLEAIPPCPLHGSQCIPHALDWIQNAIAEQKLREHTTPQVIPDRYNKDNFMIELIATVEKLSAELETLKARVATLEAH